MFPEFYTKVLVRIMIISIFLLYGSTYVLAQHYGVRAGIVMSSITGQSSGSVSPGLQAGAYTKLGGEEVLTFKIEFLLTQKGSNNYNRNNLRNINLLYMELPLLFNLEVIDRFTFNFGFATSMLLFGSYRYTEDGNIRRRSISNESNSFDLNTLLGVEYLWNDKITFGLRYNHSFVPVSDYDSEFYRDSRLPFNRVFQLYCGYRIK